MKDYYFDKSSFIVENYLEKPTFANFLPGIAGKKGIPLWAFYVNRGQGISGFGIQDKNAPIMAFTPANKAYESVGQTGFRTFIKVNNEYYEPFLPGSNNHHKMIVKQEGFEIEEENKKLGIKINIHYFGLPLENLAGLIRSFTITNLNNEPKEIELLDGMTEVIPAGLKNSEFKEVSNILSSWMDVDELENSYAFYKLRSSTSDSSEVVEMLNGNFLFSYHGNKLVRPIVDQALVFDFDHSKRKAFGFINHPLADIVSKKQVTTNAIPSGFVPLQVTLEANQTETLKTVVGYTHNKEDLVEFMNRANTATYVKEKELEARKLIDDLLSDVETSTSRHEFNEYVKQNYLDNLLRGGYPHKVGDSIYHLYSRRHGDLERDYNFFHLAPQYYSNGAGNFRDVCQNRRMDSAINKEVGSFNVKHFASLIQLDGYNPLTVAGMTYHIDDIETKERLLNKHFGSHHAELHSFVSGRFAPGWLVNFVENNKIEVLTSEEEYLDEIICHATEEIESVFSEGYWVDHFTYILDLVETFEAVYPDKLESLLFEENDVKTFDSPIFVLPKNQKTVINKEGQIRQYGSLLHDDHEKVEKLGMNPHGSNWAKMEGEVYHTNVYTKLLILTLAKHSNLDPDLIGIEMEGNKPGWNDAMNGVPGLFGSGVSESIEVLRIVDYLLKHLPSESIDLPKDVYKLFKDLESANTYPQILDAREQYRDRVRFGLQKAFKQVSKERLSVYLEQLKNHLEDKLELLYNENDGIIPTFLTYEVTSYEEQLDENNQPIIGHYGLPIVHPTGFKRRNLPNFLEAPARLLKTSFNKDKLREMTKKIKRSGIYDDKLKMYKTSESLDKETNEIGRVRAFTAGWLERESNFLHMTYKYLLGLLKGGLYEEFYNEIEDNLVCFMDPKVYKRNTLENSSFIAPSNNPNERIHGQGFYARLSGSTAETINMWYIMMTGGTPFKQEVSGLKFKPEPKLPASYFKEDKTVSFKFLKQTEITYINEDLVDTYNTGQVYKYELIKKREKVIIDGSYVNGSYAKEIRDGEYNKIKIYIRK